MKIQTPLISLLLPALAIFLAALAQHILTIIWPGFREIRFPVATADSYFVVLTSGCLSFLAGYILRRRVGGRSGFFWAVITPSAYLCFVLWNVFGQAFVEFGAKIAWLRPSTLFVIAAAILPLLSLVLGWSYSGARTPRVTFGHIS